MLAFWRSLGESNPCFSLERSYPEARRILRQWKQKIRMESLANLSKRRSFCMALVHRKLPNEAK
jgi:hypothetical protein